MIMLKRDFEIEQTQKNFSKVVWFYDYWGKITESKAIREAISISGISNDIKVLDVGVGTGQLFEKIINKNKTGLNFGVDLSLDMISRAKNKLKTAPEKFLLSLGNAFNLPYKNESFDFIFSSYVLDLLPEDSFNTVLKEFYRVLKPNSTGVLITMSVGSKWYNKSWYLLSKYFPSLLTNCRPVSLKRYIEARSFKIIDARIISQNTFPSEIIKFGK
jgi:ubiquinone/menaquinone biosynthesis C-methylase UbiE